MIKNILLKRTIITVLVMLMSICFVSCSNESDSSSDQSETKGSIGSDKLSLDSFSLTDIYGKKVTQEVFQKNKITLVNVLSVSCGPCMEELPYLAELAEEYKEIGVGFLGISIDIDSDGAPDKATMEDYQKLLKNSSENINVVYTDQDLMLKIFSETDAIPYTFFVDQNGTVIGKSYTGSHDKDEWKEIIEKELENAPV